jgi:hypothetical protein
MNYDWMSNLGLALLVLFGLVMYYKNNHRDWWD